MLRSMLVRLVVASLAICMSLPSHAQDRDEHGESRAAKEPGDQCREPGVPAAAPGTDGDEPVSDGEGWGERIVVTATRTDRPADEIPLHAMVIDGQEVQTAPEYGAIGILRRIPSINLQGDDSLLTSSPIDGGIAFRGLGGTARGRGLLLVDGMPVNDPFGTYVIWSRVPMDTVDRIEVLPGGTGIWGNLSLSGVVNMITRGPEANRFDARARAGNYSTQEGTASYSNLGDSWAGWLSANYFDTEGYQLFREDELGPVDEPSSKDFGTLTGKLSRSFSDSSALDLGLTLFDEDFLAGTELSTRYYTEQSLTARYDHVGEGGSRWELRAYGRDTDSDEANPVLGPNRATEIPNSKTLVPADAYGLGGIWFSPGTGKHALSAGVDAQLVSIDATEEGGYIVGRYTTKAFIEGEQRFAGAFVQDVYTPSPRTSLTLGGRVDAIQSKDGHRRDVNLVTGAVTERVLIDESTETTFNPSLGIVHAASDEVRVRGALYSGFRAGAPAELFVDNLGRNVTLSNPTLAPERLIGAEAGVDFTPSQNLATRVTAFYSEGRDLIDRILIGRARPGGEVIEPCGFLNSGGTCRIRENLGEVRSSGIEIEQEVRFADHWRVHLVGTLLGAEVTSSPGTPELEGNRVLRVPEEAGMLGLQYDNPRLLHAEVRGRYMSDRWNDAENTELLPSQFFVDLSLARTLTRHWRVYGGVTNLFDRESIAGFSASLVEFAPPRLAHVGFGFASK
jgi:outer membrane receptor protein involved in Fe transport